MILSEKITELRKRSGLSQEEFGEKIVPKIKASEEKFKLIFDEYFFEPLKLSLMELKEILSSLNSDNIKEDLKQTLCHVGVNVIKKLAPLENLENMNNLLFQTGGYGPPLRGGGPLPMRASPSEFEINKKE